LPVLFFIIALLFRIPGLARPTIMDEAKALLYATLPLKKLLDLLIVDSQPPLYFYILKFWSWISPDPFRLRLLTVFLGAFICVLLFRIVKRLYGVPAANYAFIFAVLSPQLIFQSQYLRPYCMGTFFSILLVYLFIGFMYDEKRQLLYVGILGLVTAFCLYSFYMSIFIVAAMNIFALYFFWKRKEKLLCWIGSQAIAMALFSFWFPVFMLQKRLVEEGLTCHLLEINNAGIGFYVGKIHAGDLIRVAMAYLHFDDILGEGRRYSEYIKNVPVFLAVMSAFGALIAACVVRGARAMFKTERVKGASLLLVLLMLVPAISFIALSVGGDLGLWGYAVVNIRYFSQSSIYALVLLAVFLAGITNRLLKRAFFSAIIIIFILLDLNIYRHPMEIYRPAVKYLSDAGRNCRVVVLGPHNALAFHNPFSDKRFSDYILLEYDADKKTTRAVKEKIGSIDKLYFYYFKSAETMVLFPDLDTKFEKFIGGLGFVKKKTRKINDILFISYFERRR